MKDILTPKELAERWGMSERTLAQWRYLKKSPAYFRAGGIRYRLEDILEYENRMGASHGHTTA